jgi:hypothetical protein
MWGMGGLPSLEASDETLEAEPGEQRDLSPRADPEVDISRMKKHRHDP